jgi:FtsH-binding integral membrane protein
MLAQPLILIILIISLIIEINKKLNMKLTVNNFIITNYLYTFVGFLLYLFINNILDINDVNLKNYTSNKLLLMFLLIIFILFYIYTTPSNNQILLHILWFSFILLISISGYPIYKSAKEQQIITKVVITIGIIFLLMTYITFNNNLEWFDKYSSYLHISLFGLIIFQLIDLVISDNNKSQENRFWYYSIFAVLLFSNFIIYDTKRIIKKGLVLEKICNNNHAICANYPQESLNMILNFLNLFNNITNIYSK